MAPGDAAAAVEFDNSDKDFIMLKKSHSEWCGQGKVNDWLVNKSGTWIPLVKKSSRFQTLTQAMASPWNWFLDLEGEKTLVPAPFSDITKLLSLPPDQFGSPKEWMSFMGCSKWQVAPATDDIAVEFDLVPESDEEGETLTVSEIGHLPSVQAYHALDIDRDPATLEAWINDLADGTHLGDGWREVDVDHYQAHGLPGRWIARTRASLAKLTKEGRGECVRGRLQELDFPLSHWKSFARLLHENGLLEKYNMIKKYAEHYQAWRAQWGKQTLTGLGYGGIPDGEAWNPPTWTLYCELRCAAAELLALPQYHYLAKLFTDRPQPLFSRLYYALSADEVKRLTSAADDYNTHGFRVRGMIYDSILTEGTSVQLQEKHGFVVKEFPAWQDNLSMCLRHKGERPHGSLLKVAGKRMCVPNSLNNVGGSKVRKAIQSITRNGPHSYMSIQQILVVKKTGEYLSESSLPAVDAAPVDSAFLLHAGAHCAGLKKESEHTLIIADPSYPNKVKISMDDFKDTVAEFRTRCPATDVDVFALRAGRYQPGPVPPAFRLQAGGVGKRPASRQAGGLRTCTTSASTTT